MNLIEKAANGLVLAKGVGIEQINAASLTLVKSVKDLGKNADHIMLAHVVHLTNNEHFQKGGKGNTQPVQDWVVEVFKNNRTWAASFQSFFKDVTGFEIKIHLVDDEDVTKGITSSVVSVDKRDFAKIREVIGEKLVSAYNNGITQDTTGKYAKVKAPKKAKVMAGKSGANVPDSPVATVSIGLKLAEETGILAALSAVAGDKQQDNLKQLGGEVARLIEQLLNHPNQQQVRDILTSTNSKLAKGLTLSGVVDKAVA